jgi:protein-S-isoprenylcysteine O-methyltransferase Ste14
MVVNSSAAPSASTAPRHSVGRLLLRFLVRESLAVAMLAVFLFLPAGRLDWPMGWALIGVTSLWVGGMAAVLVAVHPDLIAERLGPKAGTKRWDLIIMGMIGLLTIVRCVVAGLDVRLGGTAAHLLSLQVAMLLVVAAGYGLIVWATAANAFFALLARIQAERGQTVATGGPYRYVRHPGYAGGLLIELAIPILLGSWWALLPGAVNAGLLVVRTVLEDRMLRAELDGYAAYAERVRFRLLPGVW